MDLRAESFLDRAVDAGLLSMIHRTIVSEMADQNAGVAEVVQLILNFNVCSDVDALDALRQKVETLPETDLLSSETEIKAAMPAENPSIRSPVPRAVDAKREAERHKKEASECAGIDWFCYLAISQGCISREVALGLMAEVSDIADILDFAQAVIDHWLSDDYSKVQSFLDQAFTLTEKGILPPYSTYIESRKIIEAG